MKSKFTNKVYRKQKIKGIKTRLSPKKIRKANRVRKRSSLELLIYSWLDKAKIKFTKEKGVGRCHVDIFIEPNILIEAQGCYFHFCTSCYPDITKEAKEKHMKDARRFAYLRSRGYILLEVWEHETKRELAEMTRKNLIRKIRRLIRKSKVKEEK